MSSPYLVDGRERVHALVKIGYPVGDDPDVPSLVVASNNVTPRLAHEVFREACKRYGVREDDLQDAQDALADRVFPVDNPEHRTTLALGAVTVEQDDFVVDWRALSWTTTQTERGETA